MLEFLIQCSSALHDYLTIQCLKNWLSGKTLTHDTTIGRLEIWSKLVVFELSFTLFFFQEICYTCIPVQNMSFQHKLKCIMYDKQTFKMTFKCCSLIGHLAFEPKQIEFSRVFPLWYNCLMTQALSTLTLHV